MSLRVPRFPVPASLLAFALGAATLAAAPVAHAERATIGPHLGVNFDVDDLLIGAEARIDVATLGRNVIVQLNPSFSYYFVDNYDLLNISFNVPFEFVIENSVLRPFVAPGLGLFTGDHTDLKLNMLGGMLFRLDAIDPFVQLRVAFIDGSTVDLMGGVLFRL